MRILLYLIGFLLLFTGCDEIYISEQQGIITIKDKTYTSWYNVNLKINDTMVSVNPEKLQTNWGLTFQIEYPYDVYIEFKKFGKTLVYSGTVRPTQVLTLNYNGTFTISNY